VNFSEKIMIKAKTIWNEEGEIFESEETSFEMQIPELIANVDMEVKPGITRNYYKQMGKSRELPKLDSLTPKKSEVVNKIDGISYENENMFALRFNGYLNIPEDGMYTIYSGSFRSYDFVQFQGETVQSQGSNEESKIFPLKKGLHPIKIDHFVGRGPSNYDLQIEGPNMVKQSVTTDMLFH
jgi:hypothetical protein